MRSDLSQLEAAYSRLLLNEPVNSPSEANDAFELYVFSLVLQAARDENATISFTSSRGELNPTPLQFRTSPGRIFSTTTDYTHAIISFPNNLQLEAHIGIYVQGTAGVIHECDVLVIDREEGEFCRRNNVHPRRSNIKLMSECKFYAGNLGISLGREFIGITMDIGKDGRFFISNNNSRSVDKFLAHHKRNHFFNLRPSDLDSENQVISLYRAIFRDLNAKNR